MSLYERYQMEALYYAAQYGLPLSPAHNDATDAFRHAYSSAEMTREYGSGTALIAGELNELDGDLRKNQSATEKNMDRTNKSVGREIGRQSTGREETAAEVFKVLQDGKLITTLIDDRQYSDAEYKSSYDDPGGYTPRPHIGIPNDPSDPNSPGNPDGSGEHDPNGDPNNPTFPFDPIFPRSPFSSREFDLGENGGFPPPTRPFCDRYGWRRTESISGFVKYS